MKVSKMNEFISEYNMDENMINKEKRFSVETNTLKKNNQTDNPEMKN